jgi:hypothetical protein
MPCAGEDGKHWLNSPSITLSGIDNECRDLIPKTTPCADVPSVELHVYARANDFLRNEVDILIAIVFPCVGEPQCSHQAKQ